LRWSDAPSLRRVQEEEEQAIKAMKKEKEEVLEQLQALQKEKDEIQAMFEEDKERMQKEKDHLLVEKTMVEEVVTK
jgi:hypothetical protein